VVSFTLLLLYHRGKSPRYPLDRRLGGSQSRSGWRGEKKFLSLPKLKLRPLGHPARSQSLWRLRYPGFSLHFAYYAKLPMMVFWTSLNLLKIGIIKCKFVEVCPIRLRQNLWKDLWVHGKFHLCPYVNHVLLRISMADNRNCPAAFGLKKSKAIPVRGRGGSHFLDNRLTDDSEVSLTRRPPFTPRKIPGSQFC
jgi:hypothetical protein